MATHNRKRRSWSPLHFGFGECKSFHARPKITSTLVGLMLTYLSFLSKAFLSSLIRSLHPHPTILLVKSILLLLLQRHHSPLKAREQSIHTRQTRRNYEKQQKALSSLRLQPPLVYHLAALTIKDINVLIGQFLPREPSTLESRRTMTNQFPKYWNGTVLKEAIGRGSGSRYPKNRARGDRGRVVEP
jgi:hypothetical protein